MTLPHRAFKRFLRSFLYIGMIFFSTYVCAETEQEKAIQAPVNELHASLINIMQAADKQSFQLRYDVMQKTVIENFDSPLIAKVILGRYWKTLDEKSKTDFIGLFNRLTISTYVDRFDTYKEQSFNYLSTEQMKKDRYLVKTEFVRKDDEPVSFNYIVQKENDKWKIISVIANGINDLSLKRADYSAIIKDQGFDALIFDLKEKIRLLQPEI